MHPFILEHDPNSGDHGLAFFGASLNTGAYLVNHPVFGWVCFLCSVHVDQVALPGKTATGAVVVVRPADLYHKRVYLEPIGLWMVALSGMFSSVEMDLPGRQVIVLFDGDSGCSNIRLQVLMRKCWHAIARVAFVCCLQASFPTPAKTAFARNPRPLQLHSLPWHVPRATCGEFMLNPGLSILGNTSRRQQATR